MESDLTNSVKVQAKERREQAYERLSADAAFLDSLVQTMMPDARLVENESIRAALLEVGYHLARVSAWADAARYEGLELRRREPVRRSR